MTNIVFSTLTSMKIVRQTRPKKRHILPKMDTYFDIRSFTLYLDFVLRS